MERSFVGVVFAAAVMFAGASTASAQVVIQGEAQTGGVYGSGTVYVQPSNQPQPQPVMTEPVSPYVAQPQPQPTQTIIRRSPTMSLLVPGVIALAGGWALHGLISVGISQECSSGFDCPSDLDTWVGLGWIPVAGPWLAYGMTNYLAGYEAFNIAFGIIQAAGVVLTVLGVAIQQEWEEAVYVDLGGDMRLAFDGGGSQVGATLSF